MIRIECLYENYDDSAKVLFDVNFTFEDGKTHAIVGSSDGGKSTLTRCLNMLEIPTNGDMLYNETKTNDPKTDLARAREKIGVVLQNFNLFDHMKVISNITYTLHKVKKMSTEEVRAKGLSLLEGVGLRHRADACPHQLPGGERQRCVIARTLAMESDVLLFDEPMSTLDLEMTGEVPKVLQDLNHIDTTMIVMTHETNPTKKVMDYAIYMDKGNTGECSKVTEFFEKPRTARAKELLSKMI